MTYPMKFRVAVAKAYDECGSSAEVAEMFECGASWVRRLIRRRRLTDSLEPLPAKRPDTRKVREAELGRVAALVEATPDMTLAELAAAPDRGVGVPTMCRATRKLGLTLKKSPRAPPSRTARTSRRCATAGSGGSPA